MMLRQERRALLIPYTRNANILSGVGWRFSGASSCIWNQADEGLGMRRRILNRVAVAMTPVFVSNSLGGKNFLVNVLKVPEGKIRIIHNGVSLPPPGASRQEWRNRLGIPPETYVATMVANITRFKDHLTLIEAWKTVLDNCVSRPLPVLLLAGRHEGPEKELMDLAARFKIYSSIRFLGEVTDVSGLLAASDLFVYSSVSEGLPNAVVEAMLAGLPVAATDIPGIVEAVGPSNKGFLAPVGDVRTLAERIVELMADPDMCREYGLKLRDRAKSEFALEMMLEQSVALCCRHLIGAQPRQL